MNMEILQNVTPIKLKRENPANSSMTSLESQCSYFNMNDWSESDVSDGASIFSSSSCNVTPQQHPVHSLTPQKTNDARKTLFTQPNYPPSDKSATDKG